MLSIKLVPWHGAYQPDGTKIADAVIEGRSGIGQMPAAVAEESEIPAEVGETIELSEPLIFTPDEE